MKDAPPFWGKRGRPYARLTGIRDRRGEGGVSSMVEEVGKE
jgi:hypothetical protein